MDLPHGGHLSHGSPVNSQRLLWQAVPLRRRPATGRIDYDAVREQARARAARSSSSRAAARMPRIIDFAAFAASPTRSGAIFLVDMAHFAGLVGRRRLSVARAARPRRHEHDAQDAARPARRAHPLHGRARQGDRQVGVPRHPGRPARARDRRQGGRVRGGARPPLQATPRQVVDNAKALAEALVERGFAIVSGGTDNHLMLVDLRPKGLTGKVAEKTLDQAGITVNKNTVPDDPQSPFVTSGIRLGTPALTTRGMGTAEMLRIAELIDRALTHPDEATLARVRRRSRS